MKQLIIVLLLITHCAFSQNASQDIFLKVTEADLNKRAYAIDATAPALIIAVLPGHNLSMKMHVV